MPFVFKELVFQLFLNLSLSSDALEMIFKYQIGEKICRFFPSSWVEVKSFWEVKNDWF